MNTPQELITDIQCGKMVILVDDESRENEGDLIVAADFITPEAINFMATEARGLICLSLTSEQIQKLNLPLMVRDEYNHSPNNTAFTVSIEAAQGVSTGISAADRALTVRVAANPKAQAADIITPGHIFPIRAQKGGVLKRAGHTEASVDLARLAGLNPAAVICEIMNSDGSMARVPDLKSFAQKHNIKIGTIEDLIEYRISNETFVVEKSRAKANSPWLEGFEVRVFEDQLDGTEHIVFVKGPIQETSIVRMQKSNVLLDVFGINEEEEGHSLKRALELIHQYEQGVLVYLKNPAPIATQLTDPENFRHAHKLNQRNYGVGAQILRSLGVKQIRLISGHTNNSKIVGLKGYGLEIIENIPLYESTSIPSENLEIEKKHNEVSQGVRH